MPPIRGDDEAEVGELSGELVGYLHHDVDVVRQELIAGGPEVDGHATDDDGVDAEWSGDSLDHGNHFERTLGQVGSLRCTGKLRA